MANQTIRVHSDTFSFFGNQVDPEFQMEPVDVGEVWGIDVYPMSQRPAFNNGENTIEYFFQVNLSYITSGNTTDAVQIGGQIFDAPHRFGQNNFPATTVKQLRTATIPYQGFKVVSLQSGIKAGNRGEQKMACFLFSKGVTISAVEFNVVPRALNVVESGADRDIPVVTDSDDGASFDGGVMTTMDAKLPRNETTFVTWVAYIPS